jgi:hypothetical protein
VDALGLVELERPGDGLNDAVGGTGGIAALRAGVVLTGNAPEQSHLFAA